MPPTPCLATQVGRGGEKIHLQWLREATDADGGVDDEDAATIGSALCSTP